MYIDNGHEFREFVKWQEYVDIVIEVTNVPSEMNLLVFLECLNPFLFEGLESYFKRYIIQFSTRLDSRYFFKTLTREINQRRF